MTADSVRWEVVERVATVVLDRPERLNALTFAMADRLVEVVGRLDADRGVSVIVLAGAGDHFSSGVDLDDHVDEQAPRGKTLAADRADIAAAARRWLALRDSSTPLIAKVRGWCVGWGLEIALHTDIVVASHDARFFFPSVRNGGGLPDSAMIVHHVGPQWAKRLLVAGEVIDADRAERIGLISQSCAPDELDELVTSTAGRIARLPDALTREAKSIVDRAVDLRGRDALQAAAEEANARARRDPEVAAFGEILRREGARAAIDWRERRLR